MTVSQMYIIHLIVIDHKLFLVSMSSVSTTSLRSVIKLYVNFNLMEVGTQLCISYYIVYLRMFIYVENIFHIQQYLYIIQFRRLLDYNP